MIRVSMHPYLNPTEDDVWESPQSGQVILYLREGLGPAEVLLYFDNWEAAQQWAHGLWQATGVLEDRDHPSVVMVLE